MKPFNDYTRGYERGIAELGIDKLLLAATALESASNWVRRSEDAGVFCAADRKRLAWFASVADEALVSIRKSCLFEQRDAAE